MPKKNKKKPLHMSSFPGTPDATNVTAVTAPVTDPDLVPLTNAEIDIAMERWQSAVVDAMYAINGTVVWLRHKGLIPEGSTGIVPVFETFTEIITKPGDLIEHFPAVPVPTGAIFTDGIAIRQAFRLPVSLDRLAHGYKRDLLPLAIRIGDTLAILAPDLRDAAEIGDIVVDVLIQAAQNSEGWDSTDLVDAEETPGVHYLVWSIPGAVTGYTDSESPEERAANTPRPADPLQELGYPANGEE